MSRGKGHLGTEHQEPACGGACVVGKGVRGTGAEKDARLVATPAALVSTVIRAEGVRCTGQGLAVTRQCLMARCSERCGGEQKTTEF